MGWASHKVELYRHGKIPNWLELRMLEHANPLHFVMAVFAIVGLVHGLWTHDWWLIIGSIVLSLMGHAYSWYWKP
ncbi:MAG: hypothetical protein EBT92_17460 [Planctomycetes bacterium]|jgi:hypothetical protein|nr:hypothetical protein [Planctomycetota bacterium]NBY01665.1 hypothetical protein [Planctomycetota bacterium]